MDTPKTESMGNITLSVEDACQIQDALVAQRQFIQLLRGVVLGSTLVSAEREDPLDVACRDGYKAEQSIKTAIQNSTLKLYSQRKKVGGT